MLNSTVVDVCLYAWGPTIHILVVLQITQQENVWKNAQGTLITFQIILLVDVCCIVLMTH